MVVSLGAARKTSLWRRLQTERGKETKREGVRVDRNPDGLRSPAPSVTRPTSATHPPPPMTAAVTFLPTDLVNFDRSDRLDLDPDKTKQKRKEKEK